MVEVVDAKTGHVFQEIVDKDAIEKMVDEGLIENDHKLADIKSGIIPNRFGTQGGGDSSSAAGNGMSDGTKTDGKPTPLKK